MNLLNPEVGTDLHETFLFIQYLGFVVFLFVSVILFFVSFILKDTRETSKELAQIGFALLLLSVAIAILPPVTIVILTIGAILALMGWGVLRAIF